MSHEIRTPINAILGMAHIIRREGVTAQQSERLEKIESATSHLLGTLNNILDLSKIEAGKFVLEKSPVSIHSVLKNIKSILFERAQAKGLAFNLEIDRFPENLHGDPARLQQAVLNYATNAFKFTEHGAVTLRAKLIEDAEKYALVRFEVSDTGIGIPAEIIPRLFNAFEQADNTTTRKYGGTGLGLAITRSLAELMGGEAGAQSSLDNGSTFWFTAKLEKVDLSTQAGARLNPEQGIRQKYSGSRVLLVEDEPINLEIALYLLEESGLEVHCAPDGLEAVHKASENMYDLILMDMQMPRMNGIEATKLIRTLAGYQQVPILALTANVFAEDKARCLDAGMDDFVSKPLDPTILFTTVLKWLEKKPTT